MIAATIPIDSAVIADGKMGAAGSNINISHPTGGRVVAVHARNGDIVKSNEPIIEIDPSINQAQLSDLAIQSAALDSEKRRLEQEVATLSNLHGETEISLAPETSIDWSLRTASTSQVNISNPASKVIEQRQARAMEARISRLVAERRVIASRMEAQRSRLAALEIQYKQLSILRGQLEKRASKARSLMNAGHMSSVEALDYEIQVLDTIGRIENLKSEVGAGKAALAQLRAELQQADAASIEKIQSRLAEVTRDAAAIKDRLHAALLARDNTILRAPVDGVITGSVAQSVGIVVPAVQSVALLVPSNQPLEFVARIRPQDVTSVTLGRKARLKLSALNARQIDNINAVVADISADTKQDERTGESYFEARLRLAPDQDPEILRQLSVGMTGQGFILGESRTFLQYLMQPMFESLGSALREVR